MDFVLKDPRDKNDYGGNEKTGQENFVRYLGNHLLYVRDSPSMY